MSHTHTTKGFTLIELLVVVAIIGVLSSIVIGEVNKARTHANIASIQSTLRNFQTQAIIYQLDNNTFAGLCNYTNTVFHESIQPHIDKLKSIAGDNRVRCIVRTSNVPASGSHFVVADQLEQKNFGLAVYYNETHYAVDVEGVMTLDATNTGASTNWTAANQRCISNGKRLPPVEVLKAINDYGAQGGNLGITNTYHHWSSTLSTTFPLFAYTNYFNGNGIHRIAFTGASAHVRCAS